MHKVPVGVLGASGYAGRELCGLIARHPKLELAFASANEQRGQRSRIGSSEVTYVATEDAPLSNAEIVFTALPHGTSAKWVGNARSTGARVVDLSSDFRPGAGENATNAPYGLTELMREKIPGAEIVANPGCYPTAILLAIAPLLKEGWVMPGATINVSAASGVTGAGYSARPDLLFAEVAEDFRAYAVGNEHRHLAEMRAVTQELGGRNNDILFTPHLLPVSPWNSRDHHRADRRAHRRPVSSMEGLLQRRAVHRDRGSAAVTPRRRPPKRRASERYQGR